MIRVILGAIVAAALLPAISAAQIPGKAYRIAGISPGPASCTFKPTDLAKGTPWEGQPLHRYDIVLRLALREAGFTDGGNLTIEARCYQDPAQLDGIIADLATRKLDALFTYQIVSTEAAKRGLRIPIVFMGPGDPVRYGLVESIARPGGNVTGVASQVEDTWMKRGQILRELLPQARTVAVIYARTEEHRIGPSLKARPWYWERFGFELTQAFPVGGWQEIETAVAAMRQQRPDVLTVHGGALDVHAADLLRLATAVGIPTDCPYNTQVELGCLYTYSLDFSQMLRQGGRMLGKILNGANPAEMPVEQGTKFELVINQKTATALGIEIPPSLLARADRVME